jgi:hypothetical protein
VKHCHCPGVAKKANTRYMSRRPFFILYNPIKIIHNNFFIICNQTRIIENWNQKTFGVKSGFFLFIYNPSLDY